MSGTTIKRKARKNRVKAKKRIDNVKRLTFKPLLKNIDIEEIKATFDKKDKTPEKVENISPKKANEDQEIKVVDTKVHQKTDTIPQAEDNKSSINLNKKVSSPEASDKEQESEIKKEE